MLRDVVTAENRGTSQFGNRAIIAAILDVVGVLYRRCLDIGAGDGFDCSNTYDWWHDENWGATLVEADPVRYEAAVELVRSVPGGVCVPLPDQRDFVFDVDGPTNHTVRVMHARATPDNVNELVGRGPYDFASIDVDGADVHLWRAMATDPVVVCIERNQSVPWWIDVEQATVDGSFGASAAAIERTARQNGYRLVEAVGPDMFYVNSRAVGAATADGLAAGRSPEEILMDHDRLEPALTYLATDYTGRPRLLGAEPPWGLAVGIEQDVTPLTFRATAYHG